MPNYSKGDKVGINGATSIAEITALDLTIAATPTQAEIQAISTKVDAILAALKETIK